ncbi:MAG: L-aspartate oxidase [Candidatus Dormibacteraeota bacterium]|nr:L-aspartate oxidase [Candidatus Dormibacteraeota bacterium]
MTPTNSQAAAAATFDVIVVGSGIAGLCATLTAAPRARVALLTKGELEDGCSRYAQGGIAVAVGSDDSVEQHFKDTIAAGRGLCDPAAVRTLVEEGPARVRQLTEWGVTFDTQEGELLLGREAAHSRARIVHARGDGTGLEIESALARRVRGAGITVLEHTIVRTLLVEDGRCCGVDVLDTESNRTHRLQAPAVILATGGAARLWRNSTNPGSATGDGVALAYHAGAKLAGLEFVQFHPTALAVEGAPRFLISEAVRGEGAQIIDGQGRRFVQDAVAGGELAGRDVVARAIWDELQASGDGCVFLDCWPLGGRAALRFPGIHRACLEYGIDITTDPIPIAPAAHYTIGGIRTDIDGASSVAGLYACGEVASSGVHGANRLASNSLLESVVFAHRAVSAALAGGAERPPVTPRESPSPQAAPGDFDAAPMWRHLADALWDGAGVVRDAAGLRRAIAASDEVHAGAAGGASVAAVGVTAAATTASIVCAAALAREESRGCHLRSDHPACSDQWHGALVMHQERGLHLDHHV